MFFSKKKEKPKKAAKAKKNTKKESTPKEETPLSKLSAADIRTKMQDGWIRAIITFELVGKPKEHIEKTMKAYMANITSDSRVLSITQEAGETVAHDDGMFSTFTEMEALVMDLNTLTWLAVNFMPASIEVIEPQKPIIEANQITTWMNDLLAKLHEASNVLREERSVNAHLTEGLNALIKNSIILAAGKKGRTIPELQKRLGIPAKQLEPFVQYLVDQGKMKKDGKLYMVI